MLCTNAMVRNWRFLCSGSQQTSDYLFKLDTDCIWKNQTIGRIIANRCKVVSLCYKNLFTAFLIRPRMYDLITQKFALIKYVFFEKKKIKFLPILKTFFGIASKFINLNFGKKWEKFWWKFWGVYSSTLLSYVFFWRANPLEMQTQGNKKCLFIYLTALTKGTYFSFWRVTKLWAHIFFFSFVTNILLFCISCKITTYLKTVGIQKW